MKKLCIFVACITALCSCEPIFNGSNEIASSNTDRTTQKDIQSSTSISRQDFSISNIVNNDTVVASMLVQGRNSGSSPSVAYVLLASGRVLCFDKAVTSAPFTLKEAKILLEAQTPNNRAHKHLSSHKGSVVETLIAHGRNSSASPSVAYVLYSNGRVVCFSKAAITKPFTLEEAKILLKAKSQGKLVYNSAD